MSMLTPTEHCPALCLFSTLYTLLILPIREITEPLLVKRDTQRLRSRRWRFRIFRLSFICPGLVSKLALYSDSGVHMYNIHTLCQI